MSTSTIYAKIAAGEFPAPHRLSARAVAWDEEEVDSFLKKNIISTRPAREGRLIAEGHRPAREKDYA